MRRVFSSTLQRAVGATLASGWTSAARHCSTTNKPAEAETPVTEEKKDQAAEQPQQQAASSSSSSPNPEATATSTNAAENDGAKHVKQRKGGNAPSWKERRHPRLLKMIKKELLEEGLRDDKPVEPKVPRGWKLTHEPCTGIFKLTRKHRPFGKSTEEYHEIIARMEIKHPEETFRPDLGERIDPQHLTFYYFITKPNSTSQGGLEFMLTSIDDELVVDAMTVHANGDEVINAKEGLFNSVEKRRLRDGRYRGPSMNELDDELLDEVLDYLDERGVNNAFAEVMMGHANYIEQLEYEHWLTTLAKFGQ